MIERILVVLADSLPESRALRLGLNLAVRHGASVTVLLVCGPPPQETGCILRLPIATELTKRRQVFEDCCQQVFAEYPALKGTPQVLVAAGFVLVEAAKAARSHGADILIIDSEDSGRFCEQELTGLTGGMALALSAATSCPVCVVPSQAVAHSGPFERVLVEVDLSSDATPLRGLLNYSARLAMREGADLHVLHTLQQSPGQPTPSDDEMVRRIATLRDRLVNLCQGLPGADRIVFIVSEGEMSMEILKHAQESRADLVILDRRRNGAGSRLERVLEGARCPLLLLRPGARTHIE
ncbi:MAG: universal stress protein [Proteobacteria bacterium]|nr:universal stress protein [Pseudomonadota bacterium]MBU1596196.1 universal stress protein [Pseudomonadota bacterium]